MINNYVILFDVNSGSLTTDKTDTHSKIKSQTNTNRQYLGMYRKKEREMTYPKNYMQTNNWEKLTKQGNINPTSKALETDWQREWDEATRETFFFPLCSKSTIICLITHTQPSYLGTPKGMCHMRCIFKSSKLLLLLLLVTRLQEPIHYNILFLFKYYFRYLQQ